MSNREKAERLFPGFGAMFDEMKAIGMQPRVVLLKETP